MIMGMVDADDRDIGREVPQGFVDPLAGFVRRGVIGDDQFQRAICLLRHRTYGLRHEGFVAVCEQRECGELGHQVWLAALSFRICFM